MFWTFSDVKTRFPLYFISFDRHMSIILIFFFFFLFSCLIFMFIEEGFFRRTNFASIHFIRQRNNNRHIFESEHATRIPMRFFACDFFYFV